MEKGIEIFIENSFSKLFKPGVYYSNPVSLSIFDSNLDEVEKKLLGSKTYNNKFRDRFSQDRMSLLVTSDIGCLINSPGITPVRGITVFDILTAKYDDQEDRDMVVGFWFDLYQFFKVRNEVGEEFGIITTRKSLFFKEGDSLTKFFTKEQLEIENLPEEEKPVIVIEPVPMNTPKRIEDCLKRIADRWQLPGLLRFEIMGLEYKNVPGNKIVDFGEDWDSLIKEGDSYYDNLLSKIREFKDNFEPVSVPKGEVGTTRLVTTSIGPAYIPDELCPIPVEGITIIEPLTPYKREDNEVKNVKFRAVQLFRFKNHELVKNEHATTFLLFPRKARIAEIDSFQLAGNLGQGNLLKALFTEEQLNWKPLVKTNILY